MSHICCQMCWLCHMFKRLSISWKGLGTVWLIIAIILPLTYTAIIKPMICTSVCDFSLFLHNCTFLQMWIYMNCAILLFLSPTSSTGVGEGK